MDVFVPAINVLTALALAALCAFAVLSPSVKDGVVIKLGLIIAALGYMVTVYALVDGVSCEDIKTLARASLLTRCGLLVICAGWFWRKARKGVLA